MPYSLGLPYSLLRPRGERVCLALEVVGQKDLYEFLLQFEEDRLGCSIGLVRAKYKISLSGETDPSHPTDEVPKSMFF